MYGRVMGLMDGVDSPRPRVVRRKPIVPLAHQQACRVRYGGWVVEHVVEHAGPWVSHQSDELLAHLVWRVVVVVVVLLVVCRGGMAAMDNLVAW